MDFTVIGPSKRTKVMVLIVTVFSIVYIYLWHSVITDNWLQKYVAISPSVRNGFEDVDSEKLQSIVRHDSKEDHGWELKMEKRFSERKDVLYEKCKDYHGNIPYVNNVYGKQPFIYSKKYKMVSCINAKVGATTLKTHFLRMLGYNRTIQNPHTEGLNKLVMAIFKFFRTSFELMGKPAKYNVKEAVPFSVFLRSVLKEYSENLFPDRHWCTYSRKCNPCKFSYDYIVKMETFEEDIRYLVQKFNIKEINLETHMNIKARALERSYDDYYKDIPADIIAQLYSVFKEDFDLFDYDLPQFAKDALSKTETRNV